MSRSNRNASRTNRLAASRTKYSFLDKKAVEEEEAAVATRTK